jgi:hypothetical protein
MGEMAEATSNLPGEPVTVSGEAAIETSIEKQQRIKALHSRLMAVYVYAIERASLPERLPQDDQQKFMAAFIASLPGGKEEMIASRRSLRPYRRQSLIRAIVESHIKSQLGEIRAAYIQMEQAFSDAGPARDFRSWLQNTEDSLARFSATLAFFTTIRRVVGALWPLVTFAALGGAWSAIAHLFGSPNRHINSISSVTFLFMVVAFICYVFGSAAGQKRLFFMASISIPSMWSDSVTNNINAENVYEAEDDLFRCIGRSKRPELPLDSYSYGLGCFLLAITAGFFAVFKGFGLSSEGRICAGILAVALLGWGTYFITHGSRKMPR